MNWFNLWTQCYKVFNRTFTNCRTCMILAVDPLQCLRVGCQCFVDFMRSEFSRCHLKSKNRLSLSTWRHFRPCEWSQFFSALYFLSEMIFYVSNVTSCWKLKSDDKKFTAHVTVWSVSILVIMFNDLMWSVYWNDDKKFWEMS